MAKKRNGEEFMLSPFAPPMLPLMLNDEDFIQKPTISKIPRGNNQFISD